MYPFRLDSVQGIRLPHTIGGESYRNNIVYYTGWQFHNEEK